MSLKNIGLNDLNIPTLKLKEGRKYALFLGLAIVSIMLLTIIVYVQSNNSHLPQIEGIIDPEEDNWEAPVETYDYSFISSLKFKDREGDSDNDGLTDKEEKIHFCNPMNNDSDFDGLLDGEEVHIYHTIPISPDSDRDYIIDPLEIFKFKTKPLDADTDDDGLNDGLEIYRYHTNPFLKDSDLDMLDDFDEVKVYYTDPSDIDTDCDGLLDGEEVHIYFTDPLTRDTDGDGWIDSWEVNKNHNPLRKDNWDNIIGKYIIIPSVFVIVLVIGLFASVDVKSISLFNFRITYQQKLQTDANRQLLFELLTKLPDNKQINVQEFARIIGKSEEDVCQLLSSIFEPDEVDDEQLKPEDFIIHTHSNLPSFDFTCFYCGNPIDINSDDCKFCDEYIVRCKVCNIPITHNESYATCASCGIVGKPEDIYGFMSLELICERCIMSSKYMTI